jgi:Spy/CpxP family protein refolding chaperone
MRNRIFVLTSILTLVAGATILAASRSEVVKAHLQMSGFQHPGDGKANTFGPELFDHIARELNLSDSQKPQVKAIFESAHATFASLHQKMEDTDKQLESVTANGQFDETQVRSLANQKAQLMAEAIVEHERMKSKIFAILTPDQRAKAEELHKRHNNHFGFH